MTPTPRQLIDGVRALLREHVSPQLQGQATFHLRKVMALLREVDWDEGGFELLRENARLERLLSQLHDWAIAHAALGIAPPVLPRAPDPLDGFQAAAAHRAALRNLVATFITECSANRKQPAMKMEAPALRTLIALALAAPAAQRTPAETRSTSPVTPSDAGSRK